MPEIKNTFLKSKMNKDLDARIVPNGEYRDAVNVSISTSEGSDVGALENIRGNFDLTNFGLTDLNLEIIGSVVDSAKNRIYFFITNFVDGSRDQLENMSATNSSQSSSIGLFSRSGAANYIAYCEIPYLTDDVLNSSTIITNVLVQGAFLNFSKTHPISGINILEDFLFWTDNRNQPRKINVETAIGSPLTHYTHEDHISVAKYAPFKPIGFLNTTVNPPVNTLKNETDEWLPATFISPGIIGQTVVSPTVRDIIIFNNTNFGGGVGTAPYASPSTHFGTSSLPNVRVYKIQDENRNYAYIDTITAGGSTDQVTLKNESGTQITNIETILEWGALGEAGTFGFEVENPNYNQNFSGDKDLLKEKFVKFSYRFKYEDDEYSLVAPFSQTAFIPKQFGYFVGNDDEKTKDSSIVEFMENQVTTAGLVIDLPYSPSDIKERLKLNEIQLLYKASDEQTLKVIADVKVPDITGIVDDPLTILYAGTGFITAPNKPTSGGSGTGLTVDVIASGGQITSVNINNPGQGYVIGDIVEVNILSPDRKAKLEITSLNSTFIYNYQSQKPIKVLDDQEIIRVNDIIPLRAQTQEIVGNRVVYGNFLQNNSTPVSLNYEVLSTPKGTYNTNNSKEFLNNTLKQGRTYQVGLVLQDRYGRASNVIINNNPNAVTLNSTFYQAYTNGGVDPLNWPGNSLRVKFSEKIPTQKTNIYNGSWEDEVNPLGWYSYKVVVKQQDQDYYNVYVPGCLSGIINFEKLNQPLTYSETSDVSHIALTNDNVNKVSRDLKQVGPIDDYFGSSVVLYNRVKNPKLGSQYGAPDINEQNLNVDEIDVTTVKPFRDLGRWASMKNTNVVYVDATGTDSSGYVVGPYAPDPPAASPTPIYIYPGLNGNVDPFYLKDNKNPFIATLSTNSRLGYTNDNQKNTTWEFAKKLMVFETKPFKSNIDIYYESSSTGLVSDFNTSVAYPTGASGQPTSLSSFVADFKENVNSSVDVSNIFQAVDSAGNVITDNSPTITLASVEQYNGSTYTTVQSPFDLVTVQQPGFNIPPSYKITTNKPFIYDTGSNNSGNYKLNFQLNAIGNSIPVTVQESVSLSNVNPVIYKAGTQLGLIYKNYLNVDSFKNSSQSLPLDYINPFNDPGFIPYNSEATTRIVSRVYNPSEWGQVCYVTHSTNGSEFLSSFNQNNSSYYSPVSQRRLEGLQLSVVSAVRYDAGWNKNTSQYFNAQSGTNPPNRISDFNIGSFTNSTTNDITWRVEYAYPGVINNQDLPSFNVGGFKGAWLYFLELEMIDASGGTGNLSSNKYNIHFLVTKD
jgi:hypothetical protein